jgi:hypothetical protein
MLHDRAATATGRLFDAVAGTGSMDKAVPSTTSTTNLRDTITPSLADNCR